jgi:RHS repeat-associated protein
VEISSIEASLLEERSSRVLPGQYYGVETGKHYNYFRDYDPSLGGYIQSDPIGLEAGTNTYGYVDMNPLLYSDPTGELPLGVVDFSAGLGDALLLGFGKDLRDGLGLGDGGVDTCSIAYRSGGWTSFGFGGLRLAYAAAAKGISMAAASGAAASASRDLLKNVFRGGRGKDWRKPNLDGRSDSELRGSAGRTNPGVNAYGAGVAAAGGYAGSGCGCP